MNTHLVTLAGRKVTTLKPMLEHYFKLGISSARIFVHRIEGNNILEEAAEIAKPYGSQAVLTPVEGDWLKVQYQCLMSTQASPNEWFIHADQDEFQVYPYRLEDIVADAEKRGYDHITGCFVDRFASDGKLRPLDPTQPLWPQYPLGAFFTYPVLKADPRKVVAARGGVTFKSSGHHQVKAGSAYPAEECFVQVHHFKWVAGLLDYLQERTSEWGGAAAVQRESTRFMKYYSLMGGRVDINDSALMVARCGEQYPHIDVARRLLALQDLSVRMYSLLDAASEPQAAAQASR